MKNFSMFKVMIVCSLVLALAVTFTAATRQKEASSEQTSTVQAVPAQAEPAGEEVTVFFSQEELDQMLAPIALYPDALLAQVLTASTYPLEVVSAARFAKEREGLTGEQLMEAARDKDWDPSVKAMLGFPAVLAMMDEYLEWTTGLGDAFLAQPDDVMASVQRLREKAYAEGNLATTQEQVIMVEPQTRIIIIEPVNPQIVYVPVYDPYVVYGEWWYPAYPPCRYYPSGYVSGMFLRCVFLELVLGIWLFDWHDHDVYVHIEHHNDFTRHYYDRPVYYRVRDDGRDREGWKHDPRHRGNAPYRDPSTARRFTGKIRSVTTGGPDNKDIRANKAVTTKTPAAGINTHTVVHVQNKINPPRRDVQPVGATKKVVPAGNKQSGPSAGAIKDAAGKPKVNDVKTAIKNRSVDVPPKDNSNAARGKQINFKDRTIDVKTNIGTQKVNKKDMPGSDIQPVRASNGSVTHANAGIKAKSDNAKTVARDHPITGPLKDDPNAGAVRHMPAKPQMADVNVSPETRVDVKPLTHTTAPTLRPKAQGQEAPLRVNPEQAPAYRPERVEGLNVNAVGHANMGMKPKGGNR